MKQKSSWCPNVYVKAGLGRGWRIVMNLAGRPYYVDCLGLQESQVIEFRDRLFKMCEPWTPLDHSPACPVFYDWYDLETMPDWKEESDEWKVFKSMLMIRDELMRHSAPLTFKGLKDERDWNIKKRKAAAAERDAAELKGHLDYLHNQRVCLVSARASFTKRGPKFFTGPSRDYLNTCFDKLVADYDHILSQLDMSLKPEFKK